MRRVSQFVELAKGFQTAYMNAALFSVSISSDNFDDRDIRAGTFMTEGRQARNRAPQVVRRRPKPSGSRAKPVDVAIFLDSLSCTTIVTPAIPLSPPIPLRPRNTSSTDPPSTILPNPLPYPIVFKPLTKPCRSPSRLHLIHPSPSQPYRPAREPWTPDLRRAGRAKNMTWRVRAVENPVYLRLQALQNIMWERGWNYQGRAIEGHLGAGTEKIYKIVVEGVGKSFLGEDDGQQTGGDYW